MAADYVFSGTQIGLPPIADTNTSALCPLGTVSRARSETYGEGEFIYLLGVGSTVVGSLVSYNASTYQTVLCPSTAALGTPVAVAMSANVASQYGWYQIEGLAVIKKTAVQCIPQGKIYISGTAGRVYITSASGKQILGAKAANLTTVTSTTSVLTVLIQRPHAQGQIT